MRQRVLLGASLCTIAALSGCAAFTEEPASATPEYVYVIGQMDTSPGVWLCPAHRAKRRCTPIGAAGR